MTAYNICQSGLGICFIGDIILSRIPHNKNVVYYRLPTQHNTRRVCFYWKKGRYFSRAMEEFLNECCLMDESPSAFTWMKSPRPCNTLPYKRGTLPDLIDKKWAATCFHRLQPIFIFTLKGYLITYCLMQPVQQPVLRSAHGTVSRKHSLSLPYGRTLRSLDLHRAHHRYRTLSSVW